MSNKNLIEAARAMLQAVTYTGDIPLAKHEADIKHAKPALLRAIAEAEQAESQTQERSMEAAEEIARHVWPGSAKGADIGDPEAIKDLKALSVALAAIITKHAPDATLECEAIEALRGIIRLDASSEPYHHLSCPHYYLSHQTHEQCTCGLNKAREVLRRAEGKA